MQALQERRTQAKKEKIAQIKFHRNMKPLKTIFKFVDLMCSNQEEDDDYLEEEEDNDSYLALASTLLMQQEISITKPMYLRDDYVRHIDNDPYKNKNEIDDVDRNGLEGYFGNGYPGAGADGPGARYPGTDAGGPDAGGPDAGCAGAGGPDAGYPCADASGPGHGYPYIGYLDHVNNLEERKGIHIEKQTNGSEDEDHCKMKGSYKEVLRKKLYVTASKALHAYQLQVTSVAFYCFCSYFSLLMPYWL
jgi:hypothetical protein